MENRILILEANGIELKMALKCRIRTLKRFPASLD
jgi:hypothetical protein